MTDQETRLEVLKLAHTPAREPDAVIKRAQEYEKYVLGDTAKTAAPGKTLTLPSGKGPTTPKGAG